MLKHPSIPGVNPTWPRCMILLICCSIWFASLLLGIFVVIFIRNIGLHFLFLWYPYLAWYLRVMLTSSNEHKFPWCEKPVKSAGGPKGLCWLLVSSVVKAAAVICRACHWELNCRAFPCEAEIGIYCSSSSFWVVSIDLSFVGLWVWRNWTRSFVQCLQMLEASCSFLSPFPDEGNSVSLRSSAVLGNGMMQTNEVVLSSLFVRLFSDLFIPLCCWIF